MTEIHQLPNGHQIEFSFLNHGAPLTIVLLHGLIGSADLVEEAKTLAKTFNVNLLSFARPGYGQSQGEGYASVREVAFDAYQLLQSLGIKRYAVLAISAGCPYGLAFQSFPVKPVTTFVVSGLPAVFHASVLKRYSLASRLFFFIFRRAPKAWSKALLKAIVNQVAESSEPDDPTIKASLANEMSGLLREVALQQRDWGFSLAELTAVSWFHGRQDVQVPLGCVEQSLAYSPATELTVIEDLEHFPQAHHWRRIFSAISIASAQPDPQNHDLLAARIA